MPMPRPKRSDRKQSQGMPQIPINWDMVDHMLMNDCTGIEVAAAIGCAPNTFYDRTLQEKGVTLTEYAASKRAKGNTLLRNRQQEVALEGNTTMLIWLGKQRLDQREPDSRGNITIDNALLDAAAKVLNQISSAHGLLKMEDTKSITESKSAEDTGNLIADSGNES